MTRRWCDDGVVGNVSHRPCVESGRQQLLLQHRQGADQLQLAVDVVQRGGELREAGRYGGASPMLLGHQAGFGRVARKAEFGHARLWVDHVPPLNHRLSHHVVVAGPKFLVRVGGRAVFPPHGSAQVGLRWAESPLEA